jgi:anti-sigma factor RsiW
MSCQSVQRIISAYLDQNLAGEERNYVTRHLAVCRECAARSEQTQRVRGMLRNLPAAQPSAELRMRLRVMASHERSRRLSRVSFGARLRAWHSQLALFADNLMRPLALPFAGGVLSSLVLFSTLVPNLMFQFRVANDIPTPFYTQAGLVLAAPSAFTDNEAAVELTLNERGQVTDYSIVFGKLDPSKLWDLVHFSHFEPATLFGQPTSGKVIVRFPKSIVVRG